MYGLARQLEVIVGTFEIGNLWQKLENFFFSLIMGLIMGGSEFFSKFLSGLSHQWCPRARVWAFMPTRGDCGYIWDRILRQKLENFFYSLIMGFIMGGSEFFSKFLSGLSYQRRPRTRVWACTPTRVDCGPFWDWKFAAKIRELFSL